MASWSRLGTPQESQGGGLGFGSLATTGAPGTPLGSGGVFPAADAGEGWNVASPSGGDGGGGRRVSSREAARAAAAVAEALRRRGLDVDLVFEVGRLAAEGMPAHARGAAEAMPAPHKQKDARVPRGMCGLLVGVWVCCPPPPSSSLRVWPRFLPSSSHGQARALSSPAAPLSCPSQLPLSAAPLSCPSQLPLSAAPLSCPSQLPLSAAPLSCPSQLPLSAGPLSCPSQLPLSAAPLSCPSQLPLSAAPLSCPS